MQGTVKVGAGSYTTQLPLKAKEPAGAPYVVAGLTRPIPTNDWWSSLVFNRYSNLMFPHPLGLEAQATGLRLFYPGSGYTANAEGVFTALPRNPEDLVIGLASEPTFPDARAADWSDWFVTAAFGEHLRLTFGHGCPFVFGTLTQGEASITFGSPPTVLAGTPQSATLTVRVGSRVWALFGPTGSHWDGHGTKRLTLKAAGKPYFSVALLPDDRPETLALFARYAHHHVTGSTVRWRYDEKTSQVTTRYTVTTRALEGQGMGTLLCLLPHHAARTKAPRTRLSYLCSRGTIPVIEGTGFTTVTPFQGVLPLLPALGTHDKGTLKRYIDADAQSYKPELTDTYWTGKALGKLATLAALADASGNKAAATTFRNRTKSLLESYFTADSDPKGVFYYSKTWTTLIGYPASYGSDESLNDHHFHYGYFIRAAAEVVRQEPSWAKAWGGMVELLIRDCANPERNDPLFPFLRNFDLYEGHTWADGKGDFADGNNNESSSEAMNAWTGLILWGELTGNKPLRDLGIFLYVTEKDAIEHYWFNVPDSYPKGLTAPMIAMVWGAKAVYATWFSGDPIHMHGINLLPFQSGSLYLGADPRYIPKNIAGLEKARLAHDKKQPKYDPSKPPRIGKDWGGWGDLILMYQALSDPETALKSCDFDQQEIEAGNSRAQFYLWVHFLNQVGQVDTTITADTPLYTVFKKGTKRTYVVYTPTPKRVTFSDGTVVNATKPGLTVLPAGGSVRADRSSG